MRGFEGSLLYPAVSFVTVALARLALPTGPIISGTRIDCTWLAIFALCVSTASLAFWTSRRQHQVSSVLASVASGILVDRLAYGAICRSFTVSYTGAASVMGAGILAGIILLSSILAGISYHRRAQCLAPCSIPISQVVICLTLVLVIVLLFKFVHVPLLIGGIPEEDRSLFIGGVEIHHIVWGVLILLVICPFLSIDRLAGKSLFVSRLVVAVGLGLTIDEIWYYALIVPTDGAYMDVRVPLLVWAAISLLWLLAGQNRQNDPCGAALQRLNISPDDLQQAKAFQIRYRTLSHRLRGFGSHDSSFSGLRKAIAWEVPYLEIDTRLTKDDRIVVFHDSRLESHTVGKGLVCEYPLNHLRQVEYADCCGERITELSEFLEVMRQAPKSCQLCIDIKDFGQAEQYARIIDQYGVVDKICIVSWIPEMLKAIHQLMPRVPLSFSYTPYSGGELFPRIFQKVAQTNLIDILSRALRGFDIGLGYEMDRFVVWIDDYDRSPSEMACSRFGKGYHHAHFVSGVPGGELKDILIASRGSVGIPASRATRSCVQAVHAIGLNVRVFTLDSRRSIVSFIDQVGPDVIFTNNRRLVIPDELWRKYHARSF